MAKNSDLQRQSDAAMQAPADATIESELAAQRAAANPEQQLADMVDSLASPGDDGAASDSFGYTPDLSGAVGTDIDPGQQVPELDDTPGETNYGDEGSQRRPPRRKQAQESPETKPINTDDIHAGYEEASQEFDEIYGDQSDEMPSDLVARAVQYGMTEQQAMAYSSPDDLEQTLLAMDQRVLNQYAQPQQQTYYPAQQPPQQQPQQAPFQQQGQESAEQSNVELPELELDDDDIDPGTAEIIKDMHGKYRDVFQKQQETLAQMQQRLQQSEQYLQAIEQERQRQAAEQAMREFDDALSHLGEEYAEILGNGETVLMPQTSIEYQNRLRVMDLTRTMVEAHAREGRRIDVRTAAEHAAKILYPKQHSMGITRTVRKQLQKRQQQFTHRPTRRRQTRTLTGEERALRRADRWAAERGLFSGEIGGDLSDGV